MDKTWEELKKEEREFQDKYYEGKEYNEENEEKEKEEGEENVDPEVKQYDAQFLKEFFKYEPNAGPESASTDGPDDTKPSGGTEESEPTAGPDKSEPTAGTESWREMGVQRSPFVQYDIEAQIFNANFGNINF